MSITFHSLEEALNCLCLVLVLKKEEEERKAREGKDPKIGWLTTIFYFIVNEKKLLLVIWLICSLNFISMYVDRKICRP